MNQLEMDPSEFARWLGISEKTLIAVLQLRAYPPQRMLNPFGIRRVISYQIHEA